MEAQAILPVRSVGVFKSEDAARGTSDLFQTLLRNNETREFAPRDEAAPARESRDRAEYDAGRSSEARHRSDEAPETRGDDRYNDTHDKRPEADDIDPAERKARPERHEDAPPRAAHPDRDRATATAEAGAQEHEITPVTTEASAEIGPGNEDATTTVAPAIAADPAAAGSSPTATFAQGAVTVQAPSATAPTKPADPKDTANTAPRPTAAPAVAAPGQQAATADTSATPVLNDAETATAQAAAKTSTNSIQGTVPAAQAEAGLLLNTAQVKRPQAPGQKAGTSSATSEVTQSVASSDKEGRAATTARADLAGSKTTASNPSPVKDAAVPGTQAEAIQAARANPTQLAASVANPGQQTPAAGDAAADGLKTAASSGNAGQAPAGLIGLDAAQSAARASGAGPAPSSAADRPVAPNEVAVTIQRAAARGENRIRIQLHPAELGQVDVRLKVGADGVVRAMIQVDRPETLDIMQRDARGLERALQDAGLKTDSGSLSFNLRDDGKDGLRDQDGSGDTAMAGHEQTDDKAPNNAEAAEIPVHTSGSNRALDIRV